MALGADKAIYVHTDLRHDTQLQPLIVAKTLMHFIKRDQYDLVLLGKQCNTSDLMKLLMMTSTRQDSCLPDYLNGPRLHLLQRLKWTMGRLTWPDK